MIATCLASVAEQEEPVESVLVVDNGSRDHTVEIARRFLEASPGLSGELLTQDRNLGFVEGANTGFRRLLSSPDPPDLVLLLNQDVTLDPGAVRALTSQLACHPDAGIAGMKLWYPDRRTIQHAGGCLERPRMIGRLRGQRIPDEGAWEDIADVDFVTGAAFAIRIERLREIGLFDEIFSPGYYEDVDLCQRALNEGWRVLFVPGATGTHQESASFRDRIERLTLSHRNRLLFAAKHLDVPMLRRRFLPEETVFLEREATFDELRALAAGALRAGLRARERWPRTAPANSEDEPTTVLAMIHHTACNRLRQSIADIPGAGRASHPS
jgi:GT2 family glycosyltransferase